jgi:sialidase-1
MRLSPLCSLWNGALLGAALVFFQSLPARAEESPLPKIDLFRAGENGFALYRIPGIVVTRTGTVLAYCEARSDARSDWGEIQVHLRRSCDAGKTWEPARQIAHLGERLPGNPHKPVGGENEQTVNNPVAIMDSQTGAVHFLYCLNYARCFYIRSDDNGLTFSQPVEITKAFEAFRKTCDWKVLATGPGHGIQLMNGRLAVPVWLAYGKPGDHAPSVSGTLYSDDHGQTWQAGDVALPASEAWKNPNEAALVELSDGRVLLNARNTSAANRRLVTVSPNGADHWTAPAFDPALFDPQCMGSLIRISAQESRGRLLFCNPYNLRYDAEGREIPGVSAKRKNLSIRVSNDEGVTWGRPKTIEEGHSAYSDLALLPDGTVLCFYERRDLLTVARLSSQWLTTSALPEPAAKPE